MLRKFHTHVARLLLLGPTVLFTDIASLRAEHFCPVRIDVVIG